jgi:hypothetical protein
LNKVVIVLIKLLRTLAQVNYIIFIFEEYLHEICNVKHRQAITKMRISAHKLPLESSRYNKTPYEDRFCTLCQSNEIGDEFHYLLSCSNQKISDTRNTFLLFLSNPGAGCIKLLITFLITIL